MARSSKGPSTPLARDYDVDAWEDKLGDWIFDEQRRRIIGAGVRAYLLSREEYGEDPFVIRTRLEFTNFQPPKNKQLGMNAGIVFGWKTEKGINRYYNILLTGTEVLVERVGFKGGSEGVDFNHISRPVPLLIDSEKPLEFNVIVRADEIDIQVANRSLVSLPRPTGVVGRVGLRPWRSKMDCTAFTVTAEI